MSGRTVVVAGGGVGGAAAALLLARAGAEVTLLERVAEPRAVGAGILLQPNGLAVLYGLGLEASLRAHGRVATAADVLDGAGRTIARTPIPDFGAGLDHALCLRRSRLLATLLDALAAAPRITARFGAEVTSATPVGRVTWRDADGAEHAEQADLVIGADGLHSRVREGGDFRATRTPGHWNLRALSPVVSGDRFVERWTPLGICGEGPVDGGTYLYVTAATPEVQAAAEARDLATLVRLYAAAAPAVSALLATIARPDDLLLNQVLRVDCERWVDGCAVLVGDAAHAMAPNLGQGANSALVDVALLAHLLRTDGWGPATLLAWEARRRPAVRRVQGIAGILARVSNQRAPLVRRLRDGAVRLVGMLDDGSAQVRRVQQEDPAWLRGVVEAL